jgi:hypothetical protein
MSKHQMKRSIVVGVFGLMLLSLLSANDLTEAGLVGKVRSVDEEVFGFTNRFGEWVKESHERDTYT